MILDDREEALVEMNQELMALRRMQLLLNGSVTASMADKRRLAERVTELLNELIGPPEDGEDTTGSPMF